MNNTKRTTWVTREGEKLPIRQMASSHLLSTIHMIERNRFANATESAMRQHMENLDEAHWDNHTLQYYLQWPEQYPELVAEATRRGLIYRATQPQTTELARRGK